MAEGKGSAWEFQGLLARIEIKSNVKESTKNNLLPLASHDFVIHISQHQMDNSTFKDDLRKQ